MDVAGWFSEHASGTHHAADFKHISCWDSASAAHLDCPCMGKAHPDRCLPCSFQEGECFAGAAALDTHKALVHIFFAQRSTKKIKGGWPGRLGAPARSCLWQGGPGRAGVVVLALH